MIPVASRGRITSNAMAGMMIGLVISLILWALIVGAILAVF